MLKSKHFLKVILLISALIYVCEGGIEAFAATITGTLFHSDGVTPITSTYNIFEIDFECEGAGGGSSSVDSSTGTFSVNLNSGGICYLRAYAAWDFAGTDANYVAEWWAAPQSVRDRTDAGAIIVGENDTIENINFQLDHGAMIEGTIYQSDGTTPLTGVSGISLNVYSGTCEELTEYSVHGSGSRAYVDSSNGNFLIRGLPEGEYYLKSTIDNEENYISEFWHDAASVRDCSQAQKIAVIEGNTYSNKNFQLDQGGAISGTVYKDDGVTVFSEGWVSVYQGACGHRTHIKNVYIWPEDNGKFTVNQLISGDYKIRFEELLGGLSVASEWWSEQFDAYSCDQTEDITVTEGVQEIGKDFRLGSGAIVSGTVYRNDGTTPITYENSYVTIYAIDIQDCNNPNFEDYSIRMNQASALDGTYSLMLGPGDYYLIAKPYTVVSQWGMPNPSPINFKTEWWANYKSSPICSHGEPLTLTGLSDNKTGIDFQLDLSKSFAWNLFLPAILSSNTLSD